MFDYLFVYKPSDRTYPVRFWVRSAGQAMAGAPPELDALDGIISDVYVDDLLAGLRLRFREPEFIVERMSGTSWLAVAENFPGLYFY